MLYLPQVYYICPLILDNANIQNVEFVFSFGMIVLFNMKLWPLWAHNRSCFTAPLDTDRRLIISSLAKPWLGWINGKRFRAWILITNSHTLCSRARDRHSCIVCGSNSGKSAFHGTRPNQAPVDAMQWSFQRYSF